MKSIRDVLIFRFLNQFFRPKQKPECRNAQEYNDYNRLVFLCIRLSNQCNSFFFPYCTNEN